MVGGSNDYAEIGFVPASPNAQGDGSYAFQDPQYATSQVNYYRLRQLDSNGTSHFHRVIEVRPGQLSDVAAPILFPNPFRNAVTVRFASVLPEAGRVDLLDLQGRQVFAQNWAAGQQPAELVLETDDLAIGVYLYRIAVGGKVFTGKLVRE
jgi:hypothetical protein